MKKALVFLVCFSIIFSMTYIPGFTVDDTENETIIVNKLVSKNATAEFYHSSGVFSNPGYESDKMFDGDVSTFGYGKLSGASGHLVVIDLGKEYDITKISINFPQTTEIQSAIEALSTVENPFKATASEANIRSVVVLSNTKPATSMIKDNYTYTGEGKVVCDGSASIRYSKTFTDSEIEDENDYRFIGVWTPYSYGIAISEISVWADVEQTVGVDTTIVNKSVTKDSQAEFYHNSGKFSNTGYEAKNMLDGDVSTFGYGKLSGASGHLAVIDLGKEYDITKISINFPQTTEIQSAIDALSTTENEFKAKAGDANTRTVVVLSNTKPTVSSFDGEYAFLDDGKVVCDGSASIRYSKTFTDNEIEDGNDYRYIGVWTPYSYGIAISEINVWADVAVSVFEPMEMHFSATKELTGDGVTEFGIGQLYYNGRLVNETDEEKVYTAYVASYKDDVLRYVEAEKIVVKPNGYTDVSIPVIHKIGMDEIKGYIWDEENGPTEAVTSATRFENEYDPLFDGSILSMTPQVYDAKTIIEEYNKTATTPLSLGGISQFENVDTIFYDGIKYQGETRKTFAYVAIPECASAENPVPGVVLVHGKGGTAYDRWAKAWADKGYAAISIDTDGRMNTTTNSYPTGNTARVVSGFGHQENVGYSDFTPNESKHSDMWFYQAISDAVLAGNVLRSLPEVDASRIGITGVSYGSVITMKAIGVDNRFSFAAPVYGGGYGWESPTYWRYNMTEERKAWDPIMFLKQSGDIPVLWFVTNRDQHFGLEQISKTYVDEEVFDKANMIILNNFSHLDQLGTIIDATRDNTNGHYLTEKMQKSITDAMIEFAEKAFGQDTKGLSKVSRLNLNNGKITATVTLPEGVTADGGVAKFRYLTVASYNDLYVGVPGRETQATMWVLQADGVTLGTQSSSNSPWPVVDAVVDGTNISVTVPENATYGFVEYFDSRGILTTSELIKIK